MIVLQRLLSGEGLQSVSPAARVLLSTFHTAILYCIYCTVTVQLVRRGKTVRIPI